MKQNIFDHTSAFVVFPPVHTNSFTFENAYFFILFRPSSTVKRPKTLMETTVYDTLFDTIFKSLCFHLPTLEMERFQNHQRLRFLKSFSKGSVFICVFVRVSVDDRWKCIKKYAFSYENALVRSGPRRWFIDRFRRWSPNLIPLFCLCIYFTCSIAYSLHFLQKLHQL